MAKVPLPDRGQPLDVTYMYQLANAINDVADTVSTASSKYATIDTRQVGKQTFKIPDIRIYAGYTDMATAESVTATQVIEKAIDFGVSFKYPPIVIASVVNNNTQAVGNSATVIVSSVSTTASSFRVRFDSAGEASVGVNFIAIGVPA
jgi:hypothetical protein